MRTESSAGLPSNIREPSTAPGYIVEKAMPVCRWYRSCSTLDSMVPQSFESLYALEPR